VLLQVKPTQQGKRPLPTGDGTAPTAVPPQQQKQPSKRAKVAATHETPMAAAVGDEPQEEQEMQEPEQQQQQVPSGTRKHSQQKKKQPRQPEPQAAAGEVPGHTPAPAGRGQHVMQKRRPGEQPQPDEPTNRQQQQGSSQKSPGEHQHCIRSEQGLAALFASPVAQAVLDGLLLLLLLAAGC
jgi:hypothetical protein